MPKPLDINGINNRHVPMPRLILGTNQRVEGHETPTSPTPEPLKLVPTADNDAPKQDIDTPELRALISQIMKEDIGDALSGAIGERITRNIRKLVKAEIIRELDERERL